MTSPRQPDQRWVLALTSLASFMVALDALIVSTALDTIRLALNASPAALAWTVDAYAISFAVLLMPAAVLGDRWGRRRVFIAGLAIFTAASAACGLAPSVGILIVARAVQGAGAAAVMPIGLALLGQAYPPERRARALGTYSAVTGLATVAGPVLGGILTQTLAWQWIFWFNIPLGLAAIVLSRLRMNEARRPVAPLDLRGLALLTGAGLGLVWGLVRSTSAGWVAPEVLAALAAGVVLAATFAAYQRRSAQPLMPPRLFANRSFSAGTATMFFLNATLFGAVFLMAQYQQVALGQDTLHAGLRLLPWGVAMFAGARRSPSLAARVGPRAAIAAGLAMQAAGMAGLAVTAATADNYVASALPMIVAGIGFGLAVPAIQATVLGAVSSADLGPATGTLATIRQLGGALGLAVVLAAFTATGNYSTAHAFTDGFVAGIAVCCIMSLLGAVAGAALPRRAGPVTASSARHTKGQAATRRSMAR